MVRCAYHNLASGEEKHAQYSHHCVYPTENHFPSTVLLAGRAIPMVQVFRLWRSMGNIGQVYARRHEIGGDIEVTACEVQREKKITSVLKYRLRFQVSWCIGQDQHKNIVPRTEY